MPGEALTIGPFTSGINTLSDPAAMQETEALDIVNMDLDVDGSLISRPPVRIETGGLPTGLNSFATRILALGWVVLQGVPYLIGSTSIAVYYFDGTSWHLITNTISSTAMAQFDNKAWIVATPESSGESGYWTPASGWVTGGAVGTSPTGGMPKGRSIAVLKERLFIGSVPEVAPGTMTYTSRFQASSAQGSPYEAVVWPLNTNIFTANRGDGQPITDMVAFNNNLLIFKRNSTYQFSWDANIGQGSVVPVNKVVGVERPNCVAFYQNNLYILCDGAVYEMVNFDFTKLNVKVPFLYDPTRPGPFADETFMFVFGDRLIVRYFNRVYVFGLRTRVWTRYEFKDSGIYFGPMFKVPPSTSTTIVGIYYGGSCISTYNDRFYVWQDGFDHTITEDMECLVVSKHYDLTLPHAFKRLFWWGADITAVGDVNAMATPIVIDFQTLWQDLDKYTWDKVKKNLWSQPLQYPSIFTTAVALKGGLTRKFIKFNKALRFRQIRFAVQMFNNGTTTTAPCRLFVMVAMVRPKEIVVRQVS